MSISARFFVFLLLACFEISSWTLQAQPAGYYDPAAGRTGTELQQALHDIIDDHAVCEYSDLWTFFQSTDKKSDGTVWDMYSDIPGETPYYIYVFNQDECGNYSKEGDCFNREHSFPKSWFGGEVLPMYTDLYHLYPTDGWVNNKRGNYPYGTTASPTWTSSNGSRLGPCSYPGYSGIVFEPVDAYKGDFARSILYMAVRYFGEDTEWPGSDMTDGSQPKPWALNMLLGWDQSDPVSQKEKDRNEAVYIIQGNRNPFIDNPDYATQIWSTPNGVRLAPEKSANIRIWPNPANERISVEMPDYFMDFYIVRIINTTGKVVKELTAGGKYYDADVSQLQAGFYILVVSDNKNVLQAPFLIFR